MARLEIATPLRLARRRGRVGAQALLCDLRAKQRTVLTAWSGYRILICLREVSGGAGTDTLRRGDFEPRHARRRASRTPLEW